MRISDWSSDVCSSDLRRRQVPVLRLAVADGAAGDPRGAGAQAGDRGRSADGLPRGPTVRRRPRRIVEAGDLRHPEPQSPGWPRAAKAADAGGALQEHSRSEEHTSDLPSLMRISYAVIG